jgi:hypothetical protein
VEISRLQRKEKYFKITKTTAIQQKNGTQRKFLPSGGVGEKKLFLIIVNVLGHPKGVGGLTSYFLRGGGMDVFWNDPLSIIFVVFEYFPFSY